LPATHDIDALILGGGIAGLWTLDALHRAGCTALLAERTALGDGQSIWSQGIIHSGLKYTLDGLLHPSAKAIRDMPARWASALAGNPPGPDLRAASVRSPHCWVWQTTSLASRLGMIGARAGLRIAPVVVPAHERPAPVRDATGTVARLDEPVLDVASVLHALADTHRDRIVRAEISPADITPAPAPFARAIRLAPDLIVRPRRIILAAGSGNAPLRAALGLASERMQLRPLRMVMVRGAGLPEFCGHCIDGATTRVTITSARDAAGRTVWQVGGELAERGPSMTPDALLAHARTELAAVLPGVDLSACEWSTYDAPRAEGRTRTGARPTGPIILTEGPVITVWPTKLALAPVAADMVVDAIVRAGDPIGAPAPSLDTAAQPAIAAPPWDNPGASWIPTHTLR
jgi:glycine/D-amino acid oxidase-like deaminating enzyme